MKDKLETLSIILILIGMLMAMNVDLTRIYLNLIGVGIAVIGMVILHAIGRDA
jgi:multisubunit Na+/H+ antiporter MnhG subunit